MTDIASIHDKFLRAVLSDKEIAVDYFKCCLPKKVVALVDLQTLTQLPDSYVSKELQKTISDIVYACRVKGSSKELKISFLLEHKSKPEKFTPVQLGSYIFSGHQKQIAQDKQLSPIIPVLLYHGKEKWKYKTLAAFFRDFDQELHHFVPEYDYIYHDLGDISDQQIEALDNKFLQASLLALKYSQLKKKLVKWIPKILALAMGVSKNLQSVLFVYTFEVSELEEDQIIRLIEDKVPADIKDTVMSTADIFVEKGKKIGLEEGDKRKTEKAIRNMIREGLPTELISKVMEVSPEYVARIQEELSKS